MILIIFASKVRCFEFSLAQFKDNILYYVTCLTTFLEICIYKTWKENNIFPIQLII